MPECDSQGTFFCRSERRLWHCHRRAFCSDRCCSGACALKVEGGIQHPQPMAGPNWGSGYWGQEGCDRQQPRMRRRHSEGSDILLWYWSQS